MTPIRTTPKPKASAYSFRRRISLILVRTLVALRTETLLLAAAEDKLFPLLPAVNQQANQAAANRASVPGSGSGAMLPDGAAGTCWSAAQWNRCPQTTGRDPARQPQPSPFASPCCQVVPVKALANHMQPVLVVHHPSRLKSPGYVAIPSPCWPRCCRAFPASGPSWPRWNRGTGRRPTGRCGNCASRLWIVAIGSAARRSRKRFCPPECRAPPPLRMQLWATASSSVPPPRSSGRVIVRAGKGQPAGAYFGTPPLPPCCRRLVSSERAKANVPLLIVTLPAMLPVVPPLPTCSVPPLSSSRCRGVRAGQHQRVRSLLDDAARCAGDVPAKSHIVRTRKSQHGVVRNVALQRAVVPPLPICSVPALIVVVTDALRRCCRRE